MKILVSALLAILGLVQLTESKAIKIEKVSVQSVEAFAENCSTGVGNGGSNKGGRG